MNLESHKQAYICIVSDQLASGGAEKVSALLSVFFEKKGIKVHHIIVVDKVEYPFSGQLLNLGKLKNKSNGFFNKLTRLKVLYRFFKNNKFDFIIDTRVKNKPIQEFIISKYIYNAPLIIIVHSFITSLYFTKSRFWSRKIGNHCYKIITVSESISKKIISDFGYKNVLKINNPVEIDFKNYESNLPQFDFKFVLAIGRMNEPIKQFDTLILCYSKSILPQKNIKLVLLGDGILKNELQQLSKNLNIEHNVLFYGQVVNVNWFYKNALYTIMSSKNEGFPNVLIESLACETPVISFDCQSGPNEIIQHKVNGLLVENQNEKKLTEAMNELFINKKLYNQCKQNAKKSITQYNIENIGQQWLKTLNL